jgi:hypothetical protein
MDKNFLEQYIELNKGTEIPESFALWCGLAGISASLGRRVWMDMGVFTVYPNLYILLVAESGRCRKSTSIGLIENLLRALDPSPNLISQTVTKEALIDSLKKVRGDEDKKILSSYAEGFVIVDEFSNFLNKKSYQDGLGAFLIPLYDCRNVFEARTRGGGISRLENLCLGILSASTVDWIRTAIPAEAIGAGLTSRFIFVPETPGEISPVAIPRFSAMKKQLQEILMKKLMKISQISGEISFAGEEAEKFYTKIYEEFFKSSGLFSNPYLAGYASRKYVHLLKIAICFAVSDGSSEKPSIKIQHLQAANALLNSLEPRLPAVLAQIASSDKGSIEKAIYESISRSGGLTKVGILQNFSYRISSLELDDVLRTLIHARKIEAGSNGREVIYRPISG